MPPKFAQEKVQRERTRDPDVPTQPNVLSAAELHYRVGHSIPSRSSFPKASGSSAMPSAFTSNYNIPYRQRLVAAALGTTDDPQSSNDSSSAPSSNPMSSGAGSVGTASTTSSSVTTNISKGKGKVTVVSTVQSAPRTSPIITSAPARVADVPELDLDYSYFELLMESNTKRLPEPGPDYFERRREIWKTAPPEPPCPSSPSPSRIKLEALLSQPGAVESEEVWRAGLKNVWKGLVGGNQLRKRLPLHIVLKILQAGWLRDGTWPEGMVPPPWDQPPMQTSPSPQQDDPSQAHGQGTSQQERRAHEQEAYAAALHARTSAEQTSGSAQMMHMQAYAMMGLSGGIPPGYSPSSGDNPEAGYYVMPYAYSESSPSPGSKGVPESEARWEGRSSERRLGQEQVEGERRSIGDREEGPPPTPLHAGQEIESEMDTEDEAEDDEVDADAGMRMEGVVQTGDDRHEGG